MKTVSMFSIVTLVMALSACAPSHVREQKVNNANLLTLDIGMTKQEVISSMGSPDMNEAYESINGVPTVILFYYTQRKRGDGNKTKDEMTPVVFEYGRLVGWGDEFYESKRIIEIRNR
jgi:outer membrane protein assembly factor BamE (lipoprotein component of BamABCDE complex)